MAKAFLILTRQEMRKLTSGDKRTEHGIEFTRLGNGDGVFTINIMVNGQRIHRVVGRESDGTTRSQAEDYIDKVRSDAKNDRLALPTGRKIALPFREAATKYLDRLTEEGGKDLKMKHQRLDLHLVPFFGNLPLAKLSSFDVERYKRHRLGERSLRGGDRVSKEARAKRSAPNSMAGNTKPGTINRELAVLSHLFTKAQEWGWIDRRPAKIKRLKEDSGRIVYLTIQQIEQLLECAKADANGQIYPFLLIGLETSMRMTEILSIRRENVNTDRRVIFVPKAKAGAREQPITAHLAEFLAKYLAVLAEEIPWLFPSAVARKGDTVDTRHTVDIRKPFRRVVQAAGLDVTQIVRHTLRHTAITHLVQAGVDLPTVQRISAHKSIVMVMRYAHANGAHIEVAMDRLQDRLRLAS